METVFQNRRVPTGNPTGPPGLGLWLMVLMLFCQPGPSVAATVEGVTFAEVPGKLYLPADEISDMLRWPFHWDERAKQAVFNGHTLPTTAVRRLLDGTRLVSINELAVAGAALLPDAGSQGVRVTGNGNEFIVRPGAKRVEISLPDQNLKAWQGQRLVLSSRICSGRRGRTPSGDFQAGPYKAPMHYSSRYDNAPMPWSVQIHGNVFIHGFHSVPVRPASHGCIRLPLNEGNPAKLFYEWIDSGTPVRVMAK